MASFYGGTMWPKPDINGNAAGDKLSRGPHHNGVSKNGDVDNLLGSVKSGNGGSGDEDKDGGEWMRRAVYQVGEKIKVTCSLSFRK